MMIVLLFVLGVVVNALYDLSAQGKLPKNKGLNMRETWKNKYKDGKVANGEKFWGSKRLFTFVTDFFHFIKFVFMIIYAYMVTFALNLPYNQHVVAIVAVMTWGLTFQAVLFITEKYNKK